MSGLFSYIAQTISKFITGYELGENCQSGMTVCINGHNSNNLSKIG